MSKSPKERRIGIVMFAILLEAKPRQRQKKKWNREKDKTQKTKKKKIEVNGCVLVGGETKKKGSKLWFFFLKILFFLLTYVGGTLDWEKKEKGQEKDKAEQQKARYLPFANAGFIWRMGMELGFRIRENWHNNCVLQRLWERWWWQARDSASKKSRFSPKCLGNLMSVWWWWRLGWQVLAQQCDERRRKGREKTEKERSGRRSGLKYKERKSVIKSSRAFFW